MSEGGIITPEGKKIDETLDWIIHIAIAVLIGFLIVTFVAQPTLVHDISMQPTLVEGDYLVVEKLGPRLGELHRGDIIVFDVPEERRLLIKRLIALEGDKLEIRGGKVFVNGEESKVVDLKGVETWPDNPKYNNITVPAGFVYAMGDNRPNSNDSRMFGPIEAKRVTGRAIFRLFPFNRIGKP